MSLFLLAVGYALCLTSVLPMRSGLVNAEDELDTVLATCGFGSTSHGYEIEAISGGPSMSLNLVVASCNSQGSGNMPHSWYKGSWE